MDAFSRHKLKKLASLVKSTSIKDFGIAAASLEGSQSIPLRDYSKCLTHSATNTQRPVQVSRSIAKWVLDNMAKCDEGYLCEVCGDDVANLTDSALYLQYVIGWIDPETLHTRRESHLRCQPNLAQFIDDSRFDPPMVVEGAFDRRLMDSSFATERAALVTRGYRRLWELQTKRRDLTVVDYPLPEAQAKWR